MNILPGPWKGDGTVRDPAVASQVKGPETLSLDAGRGVAQYLAPGVINNILMCSPATLLMEASDTCQSFTNLHCP